MLTPVMPFAEFKLAPSSVRKLDRIGEPLLLKARPMEVELVVEMGW